MTTRNGEEEGGKRKRDWTYMAILLLLFRAFWKFHARKQGRLHRQEAEGSATAVPFVSKGIRVQPSSSKVPFKCFVFPYAFGVFTPFNVSNRCSLKSFDVVFIRSYLLCAAVYLHTTLIVVVVVWHLDPAIPLAVLERLLEGSSFFTLSNKVFFAKLVLKWVNVSSFYNRAEGWWKKERGFLCVAYVYVMYAKWFYWQVNYDDELAYFVAKRVGFFWSIWYRKV